ncbi:unnamed protein product [Bathycoccus prasinos]
MSNRHNPHHHKKGAWRSVKREQNPKSIQATVSSTNFRVREHVLQEKQFTDESISVQVFLKKSKIEVFVSCALIVMAVSVGLVNTSASIERQKEVFFKPVTVLYLSFMWLLSSYLLRKRQSEIVRVIPNLGVDISGDRFYDIEKIENVIINETVTTTDAFYYVALIVKEGGGGGGGGGEKVVPLFRNVNLVPAQVLKKAFISIREKLGMKV